MKGAGPGARAPWPSRRWGVGVGSLAWPARASERTRGATGPCVGVRETQAGAPGGRGAEVSSAARAGVAGTGRPVAMATAGPAASRKRARGSGVQWGSAGTRGPQLPGLEWVSSPSVPLS